MSDFPSAHSSPAPEEKSPRNARSGPDKSEDSWATARVYQPLNLILSGSASLLRSTLSSDQRRQVEQMRMAARAVQDAVSELLGPGPATPSQQEMSSSDSVGDSLLSSVEATLDRLSAHANAREIHLGHTMSQETGLPEPVSGEHFQRILSGLLETSIELKQRGELAVLIQPGPLLQDEPSLSLQVWSSGGSTSSERLLKEVTRALEPGKKPGERVSALTLRVLALRRLIEREGSQLHLQVGSSGELVFSTLFPAVLTQETDALPIPIPSPNGGGLPSRVLMVAPDGALSASLRLTLTRLGFRSDLLGSPQQALELCETAAAGPHPYGMLILDLALQGLDPVALLEQHVELLGHLNLPVVVVGCPSRLEASEIQQRFPTVKTLPRPYRLKTLHRLLQELYGPASDAESAPHDETVPVTLPVLVVEDSPINFRVLQRMLDRLGVEAIPAASGLEALEVLDRDPIGAVLLDFQLPDLDGPEVAELIRSRSEGRPAMPIIGMTADPDDRVRQVWSKVGVFDVVSKPVVLEELRRSLGRILEQRDSPLRDKASSLDPQLLAQKPSRELEWDEADPPSAASPLLEPLSQCHRTLLEAFGNRDTNALRQACAELRRLAAALKDRRLQVACDRLSTEAGRDLGAAQEALARISEELTRIRAGYKAVP